MFQFWILPSQINLILAPVFSDLPLEVIFFPSLTGLLLTAIPPYAIGLVAESLANSLDVNSSGIMIEFTKIFLNYILRYRFDNIYDRLHNSVYNGMDIFYGIRICFFENGSIEIDIFLITEYASKTRRIAGNYKSVCSITILPSETSNCESN